MSATAKTTTDHDQIRGWARERGAQPVALLDDDGKDSGGIELAFADHQDDANLEPIDWDLWFERFDQRDLALVFQDHTASGETSNFNKLISRESLPYRSTVTVDHAAIRRWAERREGTPVAVLDSNGSDTGGIELDFPGYSGGEQLEPIDWHSWFERFEARRLALVYQEQTRDGETSRFNKLVSRDG